MTSMRYLLSAITTISLFASGFAFAPVLVSAQTPDDYGSTTTGTYCPSLSTTMVRGARDASTGGQVSELQKFLADYYDTDPTELVTGYFGRITQSYVIKFQKEQGLPSLGIAGQLTRGKIAATCSQAPQAANVNSNTTQTTIHTETQSSVSNNASGPNTLIPSTTFMNSSLAQGSTNSSTRSLVLTNASGNRITFTVSVPNQPSWLNVGYNTAPLTLESGGTMYVGVSTIANGLAAGTYTTTMVIKGNFSSSPINIPITLTVTPVASTAAPTLSASCNGSPYNSGTPGISWGSTSSGGTGSYTYQWTLGNDPTGSGDFSRTNQQNVLTTYGSTGTKSATVVVSSGGQSVTATCSATVSAPAPSLTIISPTNGSTNTTLTLYGYELSGTTEVDFYHSNGQLGWTVPSSASNISISANSIRITISGGAVGIAGPDTYQVKVVTPSGTSNGQAFTLTAPATAAPTLTSITPSSGTTNTNVTLSGSNLASTTEIDFYHSNGQLGATIPSSASNVSISANSISFTISGGMVGMAGPDTYQVKVVTTSGTSNAQALTITQ